MTSGNWRILTLTAALAAAVTGAGCGGGAASPGGTGGGSAGTAGAGAAGATGGLGAGGALANDASADATASPFVYLFDFSTGAQASTAQVANTADTNAADLGVFASPGDGGTRASAKWDQAVGSPAAGSLEIDMPCDAYGQFVDYQLVLPIITDMGHKTLSMSIRLDSGFSPAGSPGRVLLYAKSGDNWDWGQGSAQTIDPASAGQWVTYTFAMSAPGAGSTAAFDPGYVKSVGIQINTGAGSGATTQPTPAIFHVDSIGY
jgi:hypothetical protein